MLPCRYWRQQRVVVADSVFSSIATARRAHAMTNVICRAFNEKGISPAARNSAAEVGINEFLNSLQTESRSETGKVYIRHLLAEPEMRVALLGAA